MLLSQLMCPSTVHGGHPPVLLVYVRMVADVWTSGLITSVSVPMVSLVETVKKVRNNY